MQSATIPYQAIWFDLDGTLIDSARDLVPAVNATLNAHNLPSAAYEILCKKINYGIPAMFAAALEDNANEQLTAQLIAAFPPYYLRSLCVNSVWYPGIAALIAALQQRNIAWGIITNKIARYAQPLVAQLNDGNEFQLQPAALVCGDSTPQRKPHPQPLYHACTLAQVEAARCLFIGDSKNDSDAGRAAGMKTVAITYGYADDDPRTWGADYIVDNAAQLSAIIGIAHN